SSARSTSPSPASPRSRCCSSPDSPGSELAPAATPAAPACLQPEADPILGAHMPQTLELSAEPRGVFGKHVRRLRRQGIVPANIYGHGASRAIQAPARLLDHLLTHG